MHAARQARRTSFIAAASAALLTLALPQTALHAQQRDTTRSAGDTAFLATTVVTATRTPLPEAAAPVAVSVITGAELRLRGVTALADALRDVPGITFAQAGGFGGATQLFLRGGESKYVKVLVDGVPVNDPGGAFDFSTLTTDNIDRIEVVRGPTSVLYGADAVTGVIQVFTRRGRGAPHVVLSARGGTYDSRDANASVAGALGAGDFSLDLARHDTKGIYAFNNAYHASVLSGNVHLFLDERTDLRLALRYTDAEYHYPTNGGGDVVDTNAFQNGDRTSIAVDLGRTFTHWLDARLSLTSNGVDGGATDQPDEANGAGSLSLDNTRRRGADLRANAHIGASTTVTGGVSVEQEDERTQSQFIFGGVATPSVFAASRHNKAAYTQLLANLPSRVVLTAGARLDDNQQFGNFGTYRVGVNWQAVKGTRLRASAGTGFREPSFFENYSTGFVTGNPNLNPERSRSYEVGATQELWDERVTIGATQFFQRFRNMIDYTGDTQSCGFSYCNVASARADGREFEAQVRATRQLLISANFTHLETRVITPGFDTSTAGLYLAGEQLIRRPTTSWSAGASYKLGRAGLDAHVTRVGARSDRDFRPFPALPVMDPAYTLIDAGLDIPITPAAESRQASLTLRADNLFNVHYESEFNFLSPGRTLLAGARLAF
jgi:vitamin B12 transporter